VPSGLMAVTVSLDGSVGSDNAAAITVRAHARGGEGVERPLHDSTDSNDSKIHNLSNEEVLRRRAFSKPPNSPKLAPIIMIVSKVPSDRET
jgi:hypothetical protein